MFGEDELAALIENDAHFNIALALAQHGQYTRDLVLTIDQTALGSPEDQLRHIESVLQHHAAQAHSSGDTASNHGQGGVADMEL